MAHSFDPIHGITGNGSDDAVSVVPGGADAGKASKIVVSTVAAVIPAISNRVSVNIMNNDPLGSTNNVWLGFKAGEATDAGGGWPIRPQGSVAMDFDAAVDLYLSCDSGTVEVRLMEMGNT
jgi:hypothetical protein